MAGRDAASRESVHAHRRPGGARATPPIRHYERIVRMHPPKPEDTAASGNVQRHHPGGLGANKPPRWSAERRASPGAQTVKASLRGDARTGVIGPL